MAEPGRGEAPAVTLGECPPRGRIDLRGDPGDPAFLAAVAGTLGAEPPLAANTARRAGGAAILWLGPDQWLIETAREAEREVADGLARALADRHASVTAVGDAGIAISVSGPRAADLLAKGMTLDLDPARFGPGECARSLLAKIPVLLHRPGDALLYEITVARSFSEHALRWLRDAALEYGHLPGGEEPS